MLDYHRTIGRVSSKRGGAAQGRLPLPLPPPPPKILPIIIITWSTCCCFFVLSYNSLQTVIVQLLQERTHPPPTPSPCHGLTPLAVALWPHDPWASPPPKMKFLDETLIGAVIPWFQSWYSHLKQPLASILIYQYYCCCFWGVRFLWKLRPLTFWELRSNSSSADQQQAIVEWDPDLVMPLEDDCRLLAVNYAAPHPQMAMRMRTFVNFNH